MTVGESKTDGANAGPRRAEPIAIIGVSCLFPKAQSLTEYWSNIKSGVDAITEVPESHWRPEDYFHEDPKQPDRTYSRRGGFLDDVDFEPAKFGISPNSIEATDTAQLLSLLVAQGAMVDAGYGAGREFDRDRVSVLLGVTGTLELATTLGARLGHPVWRKALDKAGVSGPVADEVVKNIGDSYVAWQEGSFPGLLGNVVAGRIANRMDLGGTNCVVDAACASSLSAAHLAAMELESHRSDIVITGGVDAFNDIFMYMCFSKTPALSPTGDSRPFDSNADGTILGEGVGMLVLKRLADAERDGDRIHAVLRGIGTSSDGRGKAIYAPSSRGQVKALREAYEVAGVEPASIGLVEGHGTGTKVGDATEVEALKEVYGDRVGDQAHVALGSVKSQIGHTKAAAGIAGIIKAAMALRHKVLPPTIKVDEPNPAVDSEHGPFYVNTEKRPWFSRKGRPRRAAVSAFGFGGSNFHAVLEEHKPDKVESDWDGCVEIVALSDATREGLREKVQAWVDAEVDWAELKRRAAESRRDFKSTDQFRLVQVIERDKADLARAFKSLLSSIDQLEDRKFFSTPQGAFFGRARPGGKLGFLFPGQGAQYVGMCRDLACVFPKMHEVLTEADLAYGDMVDLARQLSDFIFPLPVFNEEARKLNELALRATQRAQPAIGAVSVGAMCVLAMFGVHPTAAAGHSFGELVALFAGGRVDATMLHKLSKLRGELMAQGEGDRGSMLAVRASADEVAKILSEAGLDLVLANKNAPQQNIISGATDQIERAAEVMKAQGIAATILPVSAAFHSPLVAKAAEPFREALDEVELPPALMPVYSNSTGHPYPEDADEARDLLGSQLARPVEFQQTIENMYAEGVTTFVEVGPGARLTGLTQSILGQREHNAMAIDSSAGRGEGMADLACTLAQLAALGYPVDLTPWEDGPKTLEASPPRAGPRMTVPIKGINYRAPRKDGGDRDPPSGESLVQPRTEMSPLPQRASAEFPPESAPASATPAPPPETPPWTNAVSSGSAASPFAPSAPFVPQTSPTSEHRNSLAAAPAGGDSALTHALQTTQQSLAALQNLQSQTARLHQQFLEGQERAQQTIQQLIAQQQGLLFGRPVAPAPISPAPPVAVSARPAQSASGIEWAAPIAPAAPPTPPVEIAQPAQPVTPALQPIPVASGSVAVELKSVLLEIVSEKTGYPSEMLDLDMDMESDLGIDSIKRVEILSAMQERLPEAPIVQPDQIAEFRTLRQVLDYLAASSPSTEPSAAEPAQQATHEQAPTPSNGSAPAANASSIAALLLEVVSEKTGYPVEMLDLEMDMESDLGIDSIKRVEILSGVQESAPDAPMVKPEELANFRTLQQIIDYLSSAGEPEEAPAAQEAAPKETAKNGNGAAPATNGRNGSSPSKPLERRALRAVRVPDSTPSKAFNVSAEAEILVTNEQSGMARRLVADLEERGLKPRLIEINQIEEIENSDAIAGLIIAASPSEQSVSLWSEEDERWSAQAFALARAAGPKLRSGGGDAFFITISRFDGAFGLAEWRESFNPVQGALAGLAKSAAREWPDVQCKAIDLDANWNDDAKATEELADEILRAGPEEIGLSAGGRRALQLTEPANARGAHNTNGNGATNGNGNGAGRASNKASKLAPGDVVVVTGGARGVTARCAVALAESLSPTLVLLGRSPEPSAEPDWLAGAESESEMKRAILAHQGDEAGSPKKLESLYRSHASNREILRTLAAIESAGAEAAYKSVDVRDGSAVAATLDGVRSEHGPIRAIVHGAGVLADRRIEDKTDEQFDTVFGTKVQGLRSLLAATADDDLKALALFSSMTGRFGRSGQADYAMANEALNKAALAEAARRPNCRVVSINWGPWAGGMVTPSLAEVFKAEGVDLIPLDQGARLLVEEISASEDGAVEVTAGGWTNGNGSGRAAPKRSDLGPAFERKLDHEHYAFLRAHVVAGRAVLPIAMMIEWLGHGALHANPGFAFMGLEKLRVYKGVAVTGEAYPIRVDAARVSGRGERHSVRVELRGGADFETLHAGADVSLGTCFTDAPASLADASGLAPHERTIDSVYHDVLFHGDLLRGLRSIEAIGEQGLIAHLAPAPAPAEWMNEPPRSDWIADPLALDAALQMGLIWTHEIADASSLPNFVGEYAQYRASYPPEGVRASLKITKRMGQVVTADIDLTDGAGGLVARLGSCEFVMDASLRGAFAHRSLAPAPAL